MLPLRDPHPDGRRGTAQRTRPGPAELRRRTADRTPVRRPRGAFPPDDSSACKRLWQHAIGRLVHRLNPKRRLRAAPRVIKRKMPKWHVKRRQHADWPRPQHPPEYIVSGI